MAEVASVYDLTPVRRKPADILPAADDTGPATPAPVAKGKWLMASVVEDAASVVARIFDEAERRDPVHRRRWVGLVDGNNHQIDRIGTEARNRGVEVGIVIDFVPRRRLREVPDQQGALPRLRQRSRGRLADRTRIIEGACRHLVKDRPAARRGSAEVPPTPPPGSDELDPPEP